MNVHSRSNDPWSDLWDLGYKHLVPITVPGCSLRPGTHIDPAACGKAPGIRYFDGWGGLPDWQTRIVTEDDIATWRDMGCGIGIRCQDGLLAIDSDCLDENLAVQVRAEVTASCGPLPMRIGQPPKALFLCRTDAGYKRPNIVFAGGEIEVRTSMQFVAVGVHPVTLRHYKWETALTHYDDLPRISSDILDELWKRLLAILPNARLTVAPSDVVIPQEKLKGDPAKMRKAVAAIPNDYADRKTYLRMGYAIKAASADWPEEGFELWSDWCSRWTLDTNEPERVQKDWDSFRGAKRVGVGWLRDLANLRTPGTFKVSEEWNGEMEDAAPVVETTVAEPRKPGIHPTPYRFPIASMLPPRESLYAGHYARKWVSSTVAPSKVGKSTLVLAEALAMASGKALLGVQPAGQFRVWWWNGEDPIDELERRAAAALQFYGLTREDIGDRLLIDSGRDMPLTLAFQEKSAAKIVEATSRGLIQAILENRIDVSIFDPFISLHKVSENDNNAIDAVAKECNQIAGATNSAIELAHHTRKLYGSGATVEDGRGASALLATTRSTRALAKMTKQEAKDYSLGPEYKTLFHFTDASSNIFAPDPDMEEKWMKLTSVNLNNGRGEGMDKVINGDQVGVATMFDIKSARRDVLKEAGVGEKAGAEGQTREEKALAAIRRQECRKDSRSDAWIGVPLAQALGIDRDSPEGLAQIKNIIKEWLKSGKLVERQGFNKARQPKTFIDAPVQSVANDRTTDLFG